MIKRLENRPGRRLRRLATVTLLGAALSSAAPAEPAPAVEPAALDRRLTLDRAELELSRAERFYFVLDAGRSRLRLMYAGAALRDYSLLGAELGRPCSWTGCSGPVEDWDLRTWTGSDLDPAREIERRVVVAPPVGATPAEEVAIPPLPEELLPAPARYRVRFDGGLALEIVAGASTPGLLERLREKAETLGLGPHDALRIRVRMPAEEAGALYRSFPEDAALLVRAGP
jgi:hypothetical protein